MHGGAMIQSAPAVNHFLKPFFWKTLNFGCAGRNMNRAEAMALRRENF
jgi:hypothetical protein